MFPISSARKVYEHQFFLNAHTERTAREPKGIILNPEFDKKCGGLE